MGEGRRAGLRVRGAASDSPTCCGSWGDLGSLRPCGLRGPPRG